MKKILSLVAVLAFAGVIAFAQHTAPQKKHKKSKEHKMELRQHYEQNVYPILKAEHDAFDASLSAEDMNYLISKRTEAEQLRQEQRNMRKAMKELKKAGSSKEEIKAEFAVQREALKSKRKNLMESLKPFAEKNESLIRQHMENLKPYHKQWKEERLAIHKKYLGEDFEKMKEHKSERKRKKSENISPEEKAKRKEGKVKKKVAKFLLWDGEMKKGGKNEENVDLEDDNFLGQISEENYQLSAFPNPAQTETTVKFQLDHAANTIHVKLADFNAAIRSEIALKNLAPGSHSVQLNLSGLEKGQYVIILEVDGQQQTTPIQIR
jgi:hypothetical protein